jgi:hypothetical protein
VLTRLVLGTSSGKTRKRLACDLLERMAFVVDKWVTAAYGWMERSQDVMAKRPAQSLSIPPSGEQGRLAPRQALGPEEGVHFPNARRPGLQACCWTARRRATSTGGDTAIIVLRVDQAGRS